MSYLLGDITLPNPKGFKRRTIEISSEQTSITGRTTKDIRARKEEFILNFEHLTPAEVSSIFSEYDLQTTRNFQVTETNLSIASTPVHIGLPDRDYMKGGSYRETLDLILTEVI